MHGFEIECAPGGAGIQEVAGIPLPVREPIHLELPQPPACPVMPFLNPRVPCSALPSINLDLWKERVSCNVGNQPIDIGQARRVSPCTMCTCTKEGPVCQSLKIENCFHLAQSFSPDSILKDHVCKVQCAFAFRAFPKVAEEEHQRNFGFS